MSFYPKHSMAPTKLRLKVKALTGLQSSAPMGPPVTSLTLSTNTVCLAHLARATRASSLSRKSHACSCLRFCICSSPRYLHGLFFYLLCLCSNVTSVRPSLTTLPTVEVLSPDTFNPFTCFISIRCTYDLLVDCSSFC